jgi:hypothetical protein
VIEEKVLTETTLPPGAAAHKLTQGVDDFRQDMGQLGITRTAKLGITQPEMEIEF